MIIFVLTKMIQFIHKENDVIVSIKLIDGSIESKKEVIENIKKGQEYIVIGNNITKKTIIKVVSDKYIRSDKNNILSDNLENLPEF